MRGPDMKSFSGSGEGSSRLIDLRLDQALISISLDFTLGGALILRVDSPGTGQPCFKSSLGLKVWSRLADRCKQAGDGLPEGGLPELDGADPGRT